MRLLYLDYNCFQRGFDDPRQIKIRLEALACEEIFSMAERREVTLAWSFMHEDENSLCPFLERKAAVQRFSTLCKVRVNPLDEVYELATVFQKKGRLSSKDAVHLACACHVKSGFLITCDEEFISRAARLNLDMKIINPVEYIREVGKS